MPEPTFDPALPDPSPSGPEKFLRPPRSAWMWRPKFGPPLTADEMCARIATCERNADFACAQDTLTEFLKRNPDDGVARAHLGLVMHHRDDDGHAVVEFKRAIDGGESTYDVFAWYADSLARVGRDAEAVD